MACAAARGPIAVSSPCVDARARAVVSRARAAARATQHGARPRGPARRVLRCSAQDRASAASVSLPKAPRGDAPHAAAVAAEAAAAAALSGTVGGEAALADLRKRLAGWPPASHAAALDVAQPAASAPDGAVPPPWAQVFCSAADRSTCVRQLWQLPCGSWLCVEARAVPSTRGVGGASYIFTALTDATAPSLRLHYCLSTAGASCAAAVRASVMDIAACLRADAPFVTLLQAHDAGVWHFFEPGASGEPPAAAAADADSTATPMPRVPGLRRAVARLRPAVGSAALCFLLQSPDGVVHNAGREVRRKVVQHVFACSDARPETISVHHAAAVWPAGANCCRCGCCGRLRGAHHAHARSGGRDRLRWIASRCRARRCSGRRGTGAIQ